MSRLSILLNKKKILEKLKVFIINQQPLVIFGFKKLTALYPKLHLIGYCENNIAALNRCKKEKPDLIILDSTASGLESLEFINQINYRFSKKNVKYLLFADLLVNLQPFLMQKVDAIVLKTSSVQTLLKGIDSCIRGFFYLDPQLRGRWQFQDHTPMLSKPSHGFPTLSKRERQILKLIAEGSTNKQIAHLLSISVKTVETHRNNLMKKLGAHKVTQLISWARRLGLIA